MSAWWSKPIWGKAVIHRYISRICENNDITKKLALFRRVKWSFRYALFFRINSMKWARSGGHFWEHSYDDLTTYGEKIALSYEGNNTKTPIFELWRCSRICAILWYMPIYATYCYISLHLCWLYVTSIKYL